jgi:hypothetical protein
MDEVLLAGTCEGFLPEPEECAGAATPEAVGRLLSGGGTRKVDGLFSPIDGVARGV